MSSESEGNGGPRQTASPAASKPAPDGKAHISVRNLTMAYGDFVVMRDVSFSVGRGEIFIIMGGS